MKRFFQRRGQLNDYKTNKVLKKRLEEAEHAVIPGFYGQGKDGRVKTFSRGGSDVTGSIVAAAAGVDVYENWTDVSGFLVADPRIVEDPETISTITYRELRELSYMGASVLHEEAIFPVRSKGFRSISEIRIVLKMREHGSLKARPKNLPIRLPELPAKRLLFGYDYAGLDEFSNWLWTQRAASI